MPIFEWLPRLEKQLMDDQGQCDIHNLPTFQLLPPVLPSFLIYFLGVLNPTSSVRNHISSQEIKLCYHVELPVRRKKLLVQISTCYLGRENFFFTHFSLTSQAKLFPTPFFCVSALAFQCPAFISHLPDLRSRNSQ